MAAADVTTCSAARFAILAWRGREREDLLANLCAQPATDPAAANVSIVMPSQHVTKAFLESTELVGRDDAAPGTGGKIWGFGAIRIDQDVAIGGHLSLNCA